MTTKLKARTFDEIVEEIRHVAQRLCNEAMKRNVTYIEWQQATNIMASIETLEELARLAK